MQLLPPRRHAQLRLQQEPVSRASEQSYSFPEDLAYVAHVISGAVVLLTIYGMSVREMIAAKADPLGWSDSYLMF
jgi:hypothetical protein